MLTAFNDSGKLITVSYSSEKGICPGCRQPVYGRNGEFRTYWTHGKNPDCDHWSEPMSQWHIDWQNEFPKSYQENWIQYKDQKPHRADILLPNGTVIEVQNSPLSPEEVREREAFYGKQHLVWVLNGEKLTQFSTMVFRHHYKESFLRWELPGYEDRNGKSFPFDRFNELLWEYPIMDEIWNHPYVVEKKIRHGYIGYVKFKDNTKGINKLLDKLEKVCDTIFFNDFYKRYYRFNNDFDLSSNEKIQDYFIVHRVQKKYWRKWIDLMQFPVFIDRFPGIPENTIFHYQGKRLIYKAEFLKEVQENKNWLKGEERDSIS